MARLPRIVLPEEPMHIMHRGNNRQDIFQREEDYFRFLEDLKASLKLYDCDLHAYVLMTNHFHFLLTPHSIDALSGLMQSIGRRYVRYVNKTYDRTGTLWEGRFKSSLIDSESYMLACYRYIEENPVRAGMVQASVDYRWSSYHYNALGMDNELIMPHPLYLALSAEKETRMAAYRQLFEDQLPVKTIALFNDSTERCNVIGEPAYHRRIYRLSGRETIRGQHGGDRKSETFKDQQH